MVRSQALHMEARVWATEDEWGHDLQKRARANGRGQEHEVDHRNWKVIVCKMQRALGCGHDLDQVAWEPRRLALRLAAADTARPTPVSPERQFSPRELAWAGYQTALSIDTFHTHQVSSGLQI